MLIWQRWGIVVFGIILATVLLAGGFAAALHISGRSVALPALLKNHHMFFFIRVEWWGPIMAIFGAVVFLPVLVASRT